MGRMGVVFFFLGGGRGLLIPQKSRYQNVTRKHVTFLEESQLRQRCSTQAQTVSQRWLSHFNTEATPLSDKD